ncbi:MAG TPA: glycosyltransferase family 4 protein [Pilimelia sp.]|nr:glycosyltransferase family 4 protein [Pilimelia sp.]
MTDDSGPLRVAYVLLRPPGHSETFISAEMRALRAAGASVEAFVASAGGGRRAEAATVLRALTHRPVRLLRHARALGLSYGMRAWLAAAHAIALSRPVAAFRPDVVHAHFVNVPVAIAVLVARDLGAPVTATAHAADFLLETDVGALRRRIARLSHLFVISAATARQLADKGVPMPAIPHGVVRAAFDGVVAPRRRAGTGPAGGGATRLVTVARLIDKKGVDTAIDAVARLVEAGLEVRYDVYGDGPLQPELEHRAETRGVGAAVTFHGAVPHEVAMGALAAADIAVLPCRPGADGDLDGIPVFLMEAAGRGVPVITTAISGIPELVAADGGWLVPPDDPAAVATAARQALDDPAEAARRAGVLAARVVAEFAPGLQAERLIRQWGQLAGHAVADDADPAPAVRRWS